MSNVQAEQVPSTSRRTFIGIAAVTAAVGGAAVASWPLIDQMNPSSDVLDTVINVDLRQIPTGEQRTFLWRRMPLFVRHRTVAEIAAAAGDDKSEMLFPQADADRVQAGQSEWLVLVGVCTYDFCTPTFGHGDYGGWGCPCCGSQFDLSGRARKGPAAGLPTQSRAFGPRGNMIVPDYTFTDDHTVRLLNLNKPAASLGELGK